MIHKRYGIFGSPQKSYRTEAKKRVRFTPAPPTHATQLLHDTYSNGIITTIVDNHLQYTYLGESVTKECCQLILNDS